MNEIRDFYGFFCVRISTKLDDELFDCCCSNVFWRACNDIWYSLRKEMIDIKTPIDICVLEEVMKSNE